MGSVFGYARPSPGDLELSDQRLRLQRAGAERVFEDGCSSSEVIERSGLQSLLASARPGDTLAVVRLDRLGRSVHELLSTVTTLRESGVTLLSLDERLDTAAAAGELVCRVLDAVARSERRLTAERAGGSTANACAENKHESRRQLDPDTAATAIRLIEIGLSPAQVAKHLGFDSVVVYHVMALDAARRGGA